MLSDTKHSQQPKQAIPATEPSIFDRSPENHRGSGWLAGWFRCYRQTAVEGQRPSAPLDYSCHNAEESRHLSLQRWPRLTLQKLGHMLCEQITLDGTKQVDCTSAQQVQLTVYTVIGTIPSSTTFLQFAFTYKGPGIRWVEEMC